MPILAGTFKPSGQAANFPDTFIQQYQTGPGLLATTGDPVPDCKGTYKFAGIYDGDPYYELPDASYAVWSRGEAGMTISPTPGDLANPRWSKPQPDPVGTYNPYGGSSGNPQVAIIPVVTIRRRIHGRPHGCGARRDYYEAGPYHLAGYYAWSPWQLGARLTFAQRMKEYFVFPPFAALFVTGLLTPDIIGTYGAQGFHNTKAHWYDYYSMYHVWWHTAWARWFISDTFPAHPQNGNPYWFRTDPSPYGAYAPWQGADGIATLFPQP